MRKIKVCARVIPSTLSLGIQRVGNALIKYAPDWVEIVNDPKDAELWILHVIGHGSMEEVPNYPGEIAMVQYCLTTTENPTPAAWLPYWMRAKAVWSYYDLQEFAFGRVRDAEDDRSFNFYYAPLGVDGTVFKPAMPARKLYTIGTSGTIAETEGTKECNAAAKAVGGNQFHLGPAINIGDGVSFATGLTDKQVAELWSQCSFVAGMRRIEGFELPALEALACGSRPVCFDAPHYRHWFGEHAEYVPEVGFEEVVAALTEIFAKPVRPVTHAERTEVLRKFNWQTLATGFWEALR